MRFRNQYIATDFIVKAPESFETRVFGNIFVNTHEKLQVVAGNSDETEVLLLGFVIDPLDPSKSDSAIVHDLANGCGTKDKLFRRLQCLSGRFVLFYKNQDDLIALSDACGQRQIYYSLFEGKRFLTSSPKLFVETVGGEAVISEIKREFLKLQELEREEHAWYSDESVDDRLFKVLPNHYLDVKKMRVSRIPIFATDLIGSSNIVDYAATVLEGGIEGILKRFKVIQPLTAGWDSRTLLAASRRFKKDIHYYVFDLNNRTDVEVPLRLSAKVCIDFDVVKLEQPGPDFISYFANEHIVPRFSKVADSLYFYRKYGEKKVVRISGIGSAIVKSFYGHTESSVNREMLRWFTFYPPNNAFVVSGVDRWFENAMDYCKEYGLRILDLFHWELKEGNWGALNILEQDLAIEELWPHANRNFLVSVLRLPPKTRCSPKCLLYRKLIGSMWPEILEEPINPAGLIKRTRRVLKRNSKLRYYNLKLTGIGKRLISAIDDSAGSTH